MVNRSIERTIELEHRSRDFLLEKWKKNIKIKIEKKNQIFIIKICKFSIFFQDDNYDYTRSIIAQSKLRSFFFLFFFFYIRDKGEACFTRNLALGDSAGQSDGRIWRCRSSVIY